MKLREATTADVDTILGFVRELAAYEREKEAVKTTPAQLREALFGAKPRAEALLVVNDDDEAVAFAIWFESFNTWTGKPSLYLEDVYVVESVRGRGVGTMIFGHLAKLAVARGCQRLEWSVLDWNTPAIAFYRRLGAEPLSDWTKYRLSGPSLGAAAK